MAFKFALVCFGLHLLFGFMSVSLNPSTFKGEAFLIVYVYVFNAILGIVLFPLFTTIFHTMPMRGSYAKQISNLIFVIVIVNICASVGTGEIFLIEEINIIFTKGNTSFFLFDLLNPIFSFLIAAYWQSYFARVDDGFEERLNAD